MLKIFSYLNNIHKKVCFLCFILSCKILFALSKAENLAIWLTNNVSVTNCIFVWVCPVPSLTVECLLGARGSSDAYCDLRTKIPVECNPFPEMLANALKYWSANLVCEVYYIFISSWSWKHFVVLYCQLLMCCQFLQALPLTNLCVANPSWKHAAKRHIFVKTPTAASSHLLCWRLLKGTFPIILYMSASSLEMSV